ncbi:MAG TPA: hypothetical protein DCZ01_09945 [Elusimicrobia bacterium]|nr:MAG: hypothetical protein A2X37_02950 [Elusimicrobia bacterium GWA2_66_18]HAZ08820.1 hypothetical protein [Elusimicrobiota bacterium]
MVLRPPRKPFGWGAFLKTLPLQPVPVWLLLGLLAQPAARAAPWLMRASCEGRPRAALAAAVMVVYVVFAMPLGAGGFYLLFGRQRLADVRHRFIADLSLLLVAAVSLLAVVRFAAALAQAWPALQPGLIPLRDACWQ